MFSFRSHTSECALEIWEKSCYGSSSFCGLILLNKSSSLKCVLARFHVLLLPNFADGDFSNAGSSFLASASIFV